MDHPYHYCFNMWRSLDKIFPFTLQIESKRLNYSNLTEFNPVANGNSSCMVISNLQNRKISYLNNLIFYRSILGFVFNI
jgi:hypothetical protein